MINYNRSSIVSLLSTPLDSDEKSNWLTFRQSTNIVDLLEVNLCG
jgi:hypothetical protein